MRRRQFFGVMAAGGAVALGAGYWKLPAGPAPAAPSLEAAVALLQSLALDRLQALRGWSPAEVFNHCAQSIEYSMDGYAELKPAWFRHSVGPAAFAVFSALGAMRHPLDQPIPGAPALDAPADLSAARDRLVAAFQRFAAHTGTLHPHFAYGELSHAEYAQAHVLHLYNHFSLLQLA
jgi:hypothetical protein